MIRFVFISTILSQKLMKLTHYYYLDKDNEKGLLQKIMKIILLTRFLHSIVVDCDFDYRFHVIIVLYKVQCDFGSRFHVIIVL